MVLYRLFAVVAAAATMAGSALAQAPEPEAPAAEAPAVPTPATPGPGAVGFMPLPEANATDLVATLKASGQFNTLLAAVDKAGLSGFLASPQAQGLTIFAPTDAAMATLPAGQVDEMMKTENAAQLRAFLLYHLVTLKLTKDQVAGKKGPIPTAAQKPVEADGSLDPITLNDAVVLQAGVDASNGAVFVIDRPLSPPA